MYIGGQASIGIARRALPEFIVAPPVTFTPQSSQLRLVARRCSAVPTAAASSFSPKPFRNFSPLSSAMACCHTFRSPGLSGFPHTVSGAPRLVDGIVTGHVQQARRQGCLSTIPRIDPNCIRVFYPSQNLRACRFYYVKSQI